MAKGKPDKQAEAKQLRQQGKSLGEIERQLGVSRSSVSRWTKDVVLSDELRGALQARNPCNAGTGEATRQRAGVTNSANYLRFRLVQQDKGRERAKKGTDLYCIGCMLFWAEGRKSRNSVSLTNTDENMLKVFVRFLRECFGVKTEEIKVSIGCRSGNGLSVEEIEDHWLRLFALERSNLNKTSVDYDKRSTGGKAKHVYGICEVTVHRTDIVQEIYGFIQEVGGFTNERFSA